MTREQAVEAIETLKQQGETEEDILAVLYVMFQDDKIDINDLGAFCEILGYELTPEFLQMSPEDQKTKGYSEVK